MESRKTKKCTKVRESNYAEPVVSVVFYDNPVSGEVGRFQVFVREDSPIDLSI